MHFAHAVARCWLPLEMMVSCASGMQQQARTLGVHLPVPCNKPLANTDNRNRRLRCRHPLLAWPPVRTMARMCLLLLCGSLSAGQAVAERQVAERLGSASRGPALFAGPKRCSCSEILCAFLVATRERRARCWDLRRPSLYPRTRRRIGLVAVQ